MSSSTKKFSHRFSGLSVWIEPDPTQSSQLTEEMESLRTKCGGIEAGLHRFVPHCTLLYNTSINGGGDDKTTRQQQGESILRRCLEDFRKQTSATTDTSSPSNMLQLIPTSQYYFPYPKTADNGKGFGCCISLLILETTSQLQLLHEIVRDSFPPDERHGGDDSSDGDGNNEQPRFRPHMALVYAPEDHENVTNGWLEKYTEQNEKEKQYMKWMPRDTNSWKAKYLSLWSTEGTLDEWYPIVKLDLDNKT